MMRFRRQDGRPSSLFFGATGWLFADLLLALTILFLVANTFGQPPPPKPVCKTPPAQPTTACVTPTPTATLTPTPRPPLVLDLNYLTLTPPLFDYNGLLNNDKTVAGSLEEYVRTFPGLAGRRAGLVLIYGGSPGTDNTSKAAASDVAQAFESKVLEDLGNQGFVFKGAVYRTDFYNFGASPGTIIAEVYLFENT